MTMEEISEKVAAHEATLTQMNERLGQTASKFPFRWWGVNSTLPGRHPLNRPPEPHSVEAAALDVSGSRD
jgi:hypothetical protein